MPRVSILSRGNRDLHLFTSSQFTSFTVACTPSSPAPPSVPAPVPPPRPHPARAPPPAAPETPHPIRRATSCRAGNRQKRPRIVVESNGVVEPRRLRRLLAKTPHPLRAVVKPPRRPQPQARIVPRQRRQFPAVCRLIQREQNDRQSRLVSKPVQQRLQRAAHNSSARGISAPMSRP